jgi:hypothetical protein
MSKPIKKHEVVDDKDGTIEKLLAVIHYLLEDRSRQRKNFGSELLIRAEFMTPLEKNYMMDAVATNRDIVVTSFRFYDPKLKDDDWKYHTWKEHQDITIEPVPGEHNEDEDGNITGQEIEQANQ